MKRIFIGTSGWSYKSWESEFYPEDLPQRRHLEFYATQFPSVEINLTFYRLPTPKAVEGWREHAPEGFVYAIKGSRFITHIKRIKELDGSLARFFEHIQPLQKRIGVILWQLPPTLRKDVARLDAFLKLLPKCYHHAVEVRHDSWLDEEVFAVLREHKVAHVSVSSLRMPMNLTVTSEIVYIRFHGLNDGAAHNYTRNELKPWAAHIRAQQRRGRTVYAYFNNDANVRAPGNAKLLMEMTSGWCGRPSPQSNANEEDLVRSSCS